MIVTGWTNGLCQDYCRGLHLWFASRIDARWAVRQAMKDIHMKNEEGKTQPASVPAGWKLVPVEPTEEMLRAGCATEKPALFRESLRRPGDGLSTAALVESVIAIHAKSYAAMLDAAPAAPQSAQADQAPAEGALTPEDRTRALNLAYQFRSHPASRGIDEIEQAGEIILSLLAAPQPEAQPQKLLGYLSEHTGPDGPYKWQFSKDLFGVYHDTALRVIPVYEPAAPSAQAEPQKPNYRAECWPESPHNKQAEQGGK